MTIQIYHHQPKKTSDCDCEPFRLCRVYWNATAGGQASDTNWPGRVYTERPASWSPCWGAKTDGTLQSIPARVVFLFSSPFLDLSFFFFVIIIISHHG